MVSSIKINEMNYTLQFDQQIDISIPLKFNGEQPNVYGVDNAISIPCEADGIVGDTRRGGSVNFEKYTLIPHCNGTHTECVGHITNQKISVRDCLRDILIPSVLISVYPIDYCQTDDTYTASAEDSDQIIGRKEIETALKKLPANANFGALIIRTLPNTEEKLGQKYGDPNPPFFSSEAIELIVEQGFRHLLVDLPSIDRMFDDGTLSNHRNFWNIEMGAFEVTQNTRVNSTITELIFVPNAIEDGEYLLNLQITAFEADASPSRPVLFPIKN